MAFDPVLTLANLLDAETAPDAILFAIANSLRGKGFPVSDWNDFGFYKTLLQADAAQFASTNKAIAALAAAGFITIAPGNAAGLNPGDAGYTNETWLDLCAWNGFHEERGEAVFGEYAVTITVAAGFGPYPIGPNGLWVTDPTGLHRYQLTNATLATLSSAAPTTTLSVRAERAGAGFNTIATSGIDLTLITTLLGVTITTRNVGAGASVIAAGNDIEADDSLRTRCIDKWPTLSFDTVIDAATKYVKDTVSTFGSVTGVLIDDSNPDGPGTWRVYITDNGLSPAGLDTDVQAAIVKKRPLCSAVSTLFATPDALVMTGDIYVTEASPFTASKAAADAAFQALQSSLPIGNGAGRGVVRFSELEFQLRNACGAGSYVELSAPVADTTPALAHIVRLPVPSSSLTWHQAT
jgi:hypothetical protein